ncbi:porin family protein [Flavisericum labens]|uniref:porin family protein n=1 Tax=Flavisericum labens TaxID=3377112 RepID=UPI00387AEC8C
MKGIITILLISFFPLLTFSQNQFGIIAGINNSTLSDGFLKHVPIQKSFGLHLGGLYQHELNNNISFRPKLMLSLQGDREKSNDSYLSTAIIDYKLGYINIPLDFKFFSKPYVIVGPQIGFLISTKKEDRDFGKIENGFDYGLNFGVGYDINDFFVEFNMYQGITKLIHIEDSQFNTSIDPTNTVLQLSIGYYFK